MGYLAPGEAFVAQVYAFFENIAYIISESKRERERERERWTRIDSVRDHKQSV